MSRVLPVLFNSEMVQAILREPPNNKTVTRRAVKGYIPEDAIWGYTPFTPEGCIFCRGTFSDGYGEKFFRLPCQKDDVLYVRETFAHISCTECNMGQSFSAHFYGYNENPVPYDDGDSISDGCFIYKADYPELERITWRPSIHMPKEAARIWLKVTDVGVERLREITERQAADEGGVDNRGFIYSPDNEYGDIHSAREHFKKIWDYTIKKTELDKYGWKANPWVWVIEFERCGKPAEVPGEAAWKENFMQRFSRVD